MRCIEGTNVSVEAKFFTLDGDPAYPRTDSSVPEVYLVDENDNNAIIAKVYGYAADAGKVGCWLAELAVPELGLDDDVSLTLLWLFDAEDREYSYKEEFIVEPAVQHRVTDIVCDFIKGENLKPYVILPAQIPVESLDISIFDGNKLVYQASGLTDPDLFINHRCASNKTYFELSFIYSVTALKPLTFRYRDLRTGRSDTLGFWVVSPQVLTTTRMVEDFINKARLQNTIPELEYTQADLVQYVFRGLALFNQRPPALTYFTGMNMQGILLDAHVICSCYYALAAQLQAEGALAFDFGGQSVSFNVDRSPSIEAALGRIEGQIDNQVAQTKRLLGKKGIFSGDGSIGGGFIDGSNNFGRLKLSNNPLVLKGAGRANRWNPFFNR